MPKTSHEQIQEWIHRLEEGAGAATLKLASVFLGFVVLAMLYNSNGYQGFSNQEAMESAHLARQLAEGKGFTTDSIRPLGVYLLQRTDTNHAAQVLDNPAPDLSNAPGYSLLLAGLMKVLPFRFEAAKSQPWFYQPEMMIAGINELLFFVAVLMLFQVARRLFDTSVAWLSAVIFAGSEVYWRFSVAGLSTMWLVVVFLGMVWCMIGLEARERSANPPALGGSLALAAGAGALAGLGGLSRYSFAWMILPALLFLQLFFTRARGKLCLCAAVGFLAVLGPWAGRNLAVSGTCFGTAGYAVVETTPTLPGDRMERLLNPNADLDKVTPHDVIAKFVSNGAGIIKNDLPRLGGNWVAAFFLCGLLLPFRNPALRRLRFFLLWTLGLLAVVQALGQTHLSDDSPEINSENLLVVVAPLALVIGTGVFFTLLDQMVFPEPKARAGVVGLFGFVMCLPLLLALTGERKQEEVPRNSPYWIQKTAGMMKPGELMMSDVPWAVAWYGGRECVWLTVDDSGTFGQMNEIKAISAVYLTQKTSDCRFVSQVVDGQHSWEQFMLEGLPEWAHGEIPTGFPLRKACLDYAPEQMFISDRVRWQGGAKK